MIASWPAISTFFFVSAFAQALPVYSQHKNQWSYSGQLWSVLLSDAPHHPHESQDSLTGLWWIWPLRPFSFQHRSCPVLRWLLEPHCLFTRGFAFLPHWVWAWSPRLLVHVAPSLPSWLAHVPPSRCLFATTCLEMNASPWHPAPASHSDFCFIFLHGACHPLAY